MASGSRGKYLQNTTHEYQFLDFRGLLDMTSKYISMFISKLMHLEEERHENKHDKKRTGAAEFDSDVFM